MNKLLPALIICLTAINWSHSQTLTSVSFNGDTSILLNPERGFYHHEQTHVEPVDENNTTPYQNLNQFALDSYKSHGTTLVLRLFYLHEFYNSDEVSSTYIAEMQEDFDLLRVKGMKAIVRFAYTSVVAKKDLGATAARVQSHLNSMKDVLQDNQDVIVAAQIGFIGTYGEGYYTDNFGDAGQISPTQWDMRSQVVEAWLNTLPASIPLMLRTPQQKAKFLQYLGESTNAVTEAEAFNPEIAKARIGHQNDCILSSPDQLIYEFKIPKSSLTGLASTINLGYRILDENGGLVYGSSDAQLPSSGNGLAAYTLGTNTVSSQTPDWANIPHVVPFANGTLLEFKAADDVNYIYVRVRMSGYAQIGKDKYQLFINTDNNTATGWIDNGVWTSSGANHLIENGVLKAHSLSGNGFTFSTVSTLQPDSSYAASFDDQGTFTQESDIDFLTEDSKYVITGGETCALTSQSQCTPFLARMALHHYTFLNEIYHQDVLEGWEEAGCYSDFQKKLGYRLRLESASVQSSVEVGKKLFVSMRVVNDGFAAPMKLRKLNLVLKNTSTNAVHIVPFQSSSADVRKWLGTITINESLDIPADLPAGNYALSIGLPDAASTLTDRPEYAIRFANTGTWDATNGVNNLGITITVTTAGAPSTPDIEVDGNTADWNDVDHLGLSGTSSSIKVLKAYDDADSLYILAKGSALQTNYQLYIDADGLTSTGFQGWVNGADYKVEGGKLYKHEWGTSWVEILTFSSAHINKDTAALEISIHKSNLYGLNEFIGIGYRDLLGSTGIGALPAAGNFLNYNLITPVTVTRPAVSITVDGASGDWSYLPPSATSSGSIELMKVYDDATNIYVLLKGDLTTTANDYEMYFNTDNSSATGLVDDFFWTAMGADYAIIGGMLYQHDPTAGNAWGWISQSHTVTTSFDGTTTTQELMIPKSKFNNLAVGTVLTVGYRRVSAGTVVGKLPTSGGMAIYEIENPYIPSLQSLVISDDITYVYLTIQGSSLPANYKVFLDTDNNSATGYLDAMYWSTMGAEYMIEDGSFYQHTGSGQSWGWTSATNAVQVTNSQLSPVLYQRVIRIPKAQFPTLEQSDVINAGFSNAAASDKLPSGTSMQSYSLTKDYIPALSNFALSDNGTNVIVTVQGSVITNDFELFLNTDNNTATGYYDGTWSTMGADFMVQNGTLYSYSGVSQAWGWTLVQSGLQIANTNVNADLLQREVVLPKSKLPSFSIGNTITAGYRNVVDFVTTATIPANAGAMLSYNITSAYVADLQSLTVTDNSTEIVITVTGGSLSSNYHLYLNTDNVASSGYIDGTWTETGIDYLLEDGFFYSYSGTSNAWGWSSVAGVHSVSDNTSGGVTTRTITLTKSGLSNLAGEIKVGYRNLSGGTMTGKLPNAGDMYTYTLVPAVQYIGETGTLTFAQSNKNVWHSKTLTRSYNNPVVIISPLSYNGSDPATVRVKNVTGSSFEYQIDEWDYLDGVHPSETVNYLVVEAGRYELDGGVVLEAGTTSVNNKWALIDFAYEFESENVPLVLAQTMTYNEATAVTTRIRWISHSDFELRVQEQESKDRIKNRVRASETVGYVALTEGSGNFGNAFDVDGTTRSYDNDFKKIWFNGTFTNPAFFAHMQTAYGSNTAVLRYRSLSSTNVSVKVEEEQSYSFETEHTREEVGYLVTAGTGLIEGTPSTGAEGSGARAAFTKEKVASENPGSTEISVYPNPVSGDELFVKSEQNIREIKVVSISGVSLFSKSDAGKECTISTTSWPHGLYILRAIKADGAAVTLKVVKN